MAEKLLNSFNLDDTRRFKAGLFCSAPEQLDFYSKVLDAGPMVIRWLTASYQIPFTNKSEPSASSQPRDQSPEI